MVNTMETLSAVLALVAGAAAIAMVLALVLGKRAGWVRRVATAAHHKRTELSLAIAGLATLGSLYFSESAGYVPCRLCWFQRIAMYPIALVALVALVRRDRSAQWYIVPLAGIGASISTYHYLIERGVIAETDSCTAIGPACAAVWFESFGFVTLSFMALCGFVAIIAINLIPGRGSLAASDDPLLKEDS